MTVLVRLGCAGLARDLPVLILFEELPLLL